METKSPTQEIMTVPELAEYLRIQRSDAYKLLKEGKISHFRLSPKRIRVRKAEVDNYLESLKPEPIGRD